MKFPGRSQRGDDEYGPAWGKQITDDTDRPAAMLDAQGIADDRVLAHARAWFREVRRDELEPLGTVGRRFLYEGSEYLLDESQSVLMDPAASPVELFFRDGYYLRFLKPRPSTNTASGLTDAVTSGELRNHNVFIDGATGKARVLRS